MRQPDREVKNKRLVSRRGSRQSVAIIECVVFAVQVRMRFARQNVTFVRYLKQRLPTNCIDMRDE